MNPGRVSIGASSSATRNASAGSPAAGYSTSKSAFEEAPKIVNGARLRFGGDPAPGRYQWAETMRTAFGQGIDEAIFRQARV